MDILDTVKSLFGGGEGDKKNDLLDGIMNLIGGQSGGLNGLVKQFTSKGLGDAISSWVGTGKNLPVSGNQIQDALGSDTIKGLASKLGMDTKVLSGQLANLLPQVIDKLTPDGKVPEGDIMSGATEKIGDLFGKK